MLIPAGSSSTSERQLTTIATGATAAMAAAACRAPSGDRCSISWPPSSDATITATLNHSHCWLMNAPLALCFCPFSTSNAPHTVLEMAMAIAVSSSANTIDGWCQNLGGPQEGRDRADVGQQQVAASPIAEQRQEVGDHAVERLDDPRHVQHREDVAICTGVQSWLSFR